MSKNICSFKPKYVDFKGLGRFLTWVTGKIDAHQLRWGEIVGGADLGQEDKEFSF